MNDRMIGRALACLLVWAGLAACTAAEPVNQAIDDPGELPLADDGHKLNLDFETGTLEDWTATDEAFQGQPIKGPIDPKRPFGAGKKSDHTGEFWIGGFEKLGDKPQGTLTSVTFKVTHPYASMLVGGGSHKQTRVELVKADDQKVFFSVSGQNEETMRPVVVDLRPYKDQRIFIRLVDEHSGGWGHVNFDDFRFHKTEPKFRVPTANTPVPQVDELYPYAGLLPDKAAEMMELPRGFKVQVAAAEPDVKQPIAMAWDHRGRLWVAEAYEYPHRAPEGQGHDRILIFEDTNGDGKFDRRKVFAENLNLVSGLEVGFGGVWVGAAPQLLFIPDRNGDDVPDGPPEVVLDGWGYQDTHEVLNTFTWGPDGWLYGCQGVFTHSNVGKPGAVDAQRVPLNACVWRLHPTTRKFEIFAEGTSNPWGVDFNDRGQAFCTACVIPHLFHVIQGARYQRQAGNHFNPYTYEDIPTIADHLHYLGNQWNDNNRRQSDELGGGHAHAGAMIYLGGAWPEKYRDQIFMNNIHGNRINQDRLTPAGSGYVGSHAPDFILTRDQWSQILNLKYGPDGQAWMIDWYDKNQCHNVKPEVHDRTNGRIFRVSYDGVKPVKVDLNKLTDADLVKMQSSPNDWYVRHARRLLQERTAAGKLAAETRGGLQKLATDDKDETRRLRGIWALHVTGGVPAAVSARLLADASPYVRGWIVQLLTENPAQTPSSGQLAQFATMAREDNSPVVRLYLASALQRIPAAARWSILEGLLSHAADNADHNLPLMYWYAAEPLADVDSRRALALSLSAGERFPKLASFMIRRIGAQDQSKSLALLVDGLSEAQDDATQLVFLRGLNESLKGKRQAVAPPAWKVLETRLVNSSRADVRLQAAALSLNFGDSSAAAELRHLASNDKADDALRGEALGFLVKAKDSKTAGLLHRLLDDRNLRGDALRGLAALDDPGTPAAILAVYDSLPGDQRRDALATLCSRPASAQSLLTAIEKKQIPASQLTADLVRQLHNLKNAELSKRIEQVWGTIRDSAADKLALKEEYRKLVTDASRPAADVELGRAVFGRTCQQCHTLFGVGGKVGPDLTGSNRANLDYLLSKVTDPSAVVTKEYRASVLRLADGRVLTGIVKTSDANSLTVQTANELVTVPKADVEEQSASNKSMMPDEQLKPMSPHEIRSLVAYLASRGQTSLLATAENARGFFNGKDLTGWRGDIKDWSVDGGALVGRLDHAAKSSDTASTAPESTTLLSEMTADDFRISLEVQVVEGSGNIVVRGYNSDSQQLEGVRQPIGSNAWSRWEIEAVGKRIRVSQNGTQVAEIDDPSATGRGNIALELFGKSSALARFRNFELKPLAKPAK